MTLNDRTYCVVRCLYSDCEHKLTDRLIKAAQDTGLHISITTECRRVWPDGAENLTTEGTEDTKNE